MEDKNHNIVKQKEKATRKKSAARNSEDAYSSSSSSSLYAASSSSSLCPHQVVLGSPLLRTKTKFAQTALDQQDCTPQQAQQHAQVPLPTTTTTWSGKQTRFNHSHGNRSTSPRVKGSSLSPSSSSSSAAKRLSKYRGSLVGAHAIDGMLSANNNRVGGDTVDNNNNNRPNENDIGGSTQDDDHDKPNEAPDASHHDTELVVITAQVVVERTDEEIEDAVRKRILAEAVQARKVTVVNDNNQQENNNSRRRLRLVAVLVALVLIIAAVVVVFVVAVPLSSEDRNGGSNDTRDDNGPMIMVGLQLDQFAVETGWNLTCTATTTTTTTTNEQQVGMNDTGEVVVSVQIPQGTYNQSFEYVVSDPIMVEYGYKCQLLVTDEFGDGFCCRHGDGFYQIFLQPNTGDGDDDDDANMLLLLQEKGTFGSELTVLFTVVDPSLVGNSGSSDDINTNSTLSPPLWLPLGQDVNGQEKNDRLGDSVSLATSIDGSTIVVAMGAPGKSSDNNPGYVKVQQYNGVPSSETFRQLGQVIFGATFDARLGSSVSLSGNATILAISGNNFVMVYGYDVERDWWDVMGGPIESDDGSGTDGFGTCTSISGDGTIVAVGAPFSTGPSGEDSVGRVQVYKFDDISVTWKPHGQAIFGRGQDSQFGYSVSISNDGRTVAVGAPSPGAAKPGYSEVYQYNPSTVEWLRVGDTITGNEDGDESGTCVSLSSDGSRVAIGSPHITGGTVGYARVLEYNSTAWNQVGRDLVDMSPSAAESVSLSGDGLTVAIGARTANNAVGRVRVFHQLNTTCEYPFCWEQVGEDIFGATPGESFGDAVSLSQDGLVLAVGAPYSDGSSGRVQVLG